MDCLRYGVIGVRYKGVIDINSFGLQEWTSRRLTRRLIVCFFSWLLSQVRLVDSDSDPYLGYRGLPNT